MSELNTLPLRIKCDPLLIVHLGFIICQNCFSLTPMVSHNMAIFSFSLSTIKFLSACLYSVFCYDNGIAITISRLTLTFPLIECSIEFPFDVPYPLRKARHSLFLFQLRLRVRFIDCHVAFTNRPNYIIKVLKTMVKVVITFKVTKSYAKWLCINRFNLAGGILSP